MWLLFTSYIEHNVSETEFVFPFFVPDSGRTERGPLELLVHIYTEIDSISGRLCFIDGARGSVVVKALCYKSEGREFDTRWCEFLNLPNPSGLTRPWGLPETFK
jgi:hypothetical protein